MATRRLGPQLALVANLQVSNRNSVKMIRFTPSLLQPQRVCWYSQNAFRTDCSVFPVISTTTYPTSSSSSSSTHIHIRSCRTFASDNHQTSSSSNNNNNSKINTNPNEWRKQQLEQLQHKFTKPTLIESDDELQPMWKEMESRVTRRKPRTLAQTGGRTGRVNVRQTDEEVWLQEGMYQDAKQEQQHPGNTNK